MDEDGGKETLPVLPEAVGQPMTSNLPNKDPTMEDKAAISEAKRAAPVTQDGTPLSMIDHLPDDEDDEEDDVSATESEESTPPKPGGLSDWLQKVDLDEEEDKEDEEEQVLTVAELEKDIQRKQSIVRAEWVSS